MARDAALKTLRDALKRRQFDGAYYVYGDDEYQRADAVKQLVDAAVDPATRDFNLDIRRGPELTPEAIDALAGTPPMMAERRVAVIREVTALKKDARSALERYLQRPSHDVTLLLVSAPGAKADKALERLATPMEFVPLAPDRLPRWIAHHAKSEHGAEITDGAVDLLQEAVGNDLHQLAAELDKLASYANGGVIDESAVSEIVGVRRGETVSDLLDRVLAHDATGALALVPHILMQPKVSAVSVVMGLATQMLAVAWGRARLDTGLPHGRLQGEYFALLKSTGAYPGRPWNSAAPAWAAAAREWTTDACEAAIDALVAADVALKESRVSAEDQILATTILAVCAAGSGRLQAA